MKIQHVREAVWGKSQATQTWAVMGLPQKAAQNQQQILFSIPSTICPKMCFLMFVSEISVDLANS